MIFFPLFFFNHLFMLNLLVSFCHQLPRALLKASPLLSCVFSSLRNACSQWLVLYVAATVAGSNFSLLAVPLASYQALSHVTSFSEVQPTHGGVLIPLLLWRC